MVRDKGLPIHREDVTVHRAHPGHRLVVQVEHLGRLKWAIKVTSMIVPSLVSNSEKKHLTHRPQRVHIGKNISVSFQSLGGSINPAGQNERSVDDFVSLWTCSE